MLRQRVVTAVIMLLVLYLAAAWLPVAGFALVLSVVLLPALLEWSRMAGLLGLGQRVTLVAGFYLLLALTQPLCTCSSAHLTLDAGGFDWILVINGAAALFWCGMTVALLRYPRGASAWDHPGVLLPAGWLVLLAVWWNLVYLKWLHDSGVLIFLLIALVSVVDIGAYFTGRAWGRSKLAPALSPNKSWAGFWGGMGASLVLAALLITGLHFGQQPLAWVTWAGLLMMAAVLAVLGVIGDLVESMLKRQRGLKDSGHFLPGHGGLLDRVDSLLAACPVYTLGIWYLASRVEWL